MYLFLTFVSSTAGASDNFSGSRLVDAISTTSLSQDEVEQIMERLLEKQDFNEEWEMVSGIN